MVDLVLGIVLRVQQRGVALDAVDVVRLVLVADGLHQLLDVVVEGVVVDIVRLHADNRLYARLVRRLIEVYRAAHVAVVGHGDGGHAKFLHAVYEDGKLCTAVENGVVGVDVEVYEICHFAEIKIRLNENIGRRFLQQNHWRKCPIGGRESIFSKKQLHFPPRSF